MRALLLVIFLSASAMVSPAVAGSPNIPPGSKIFGGVAFDAACKAWYGPKYMAQVISSDAFGWRCTPIVTFPGAKPRLIPLDMRKACEVTHGIVGLHAAPLSNADPGSWRCFDPPPKH